MIRHQSLHKRHCWLLLFFGMLFRCPNRHQALGHSEWSQLMGNFFSVFVDVWVDSAFQWLLFLCSWIQEGVLFFVEDCHLKILEVFFLSYYWRKDFQWSLILRVDFFSIYWWKDHQSVLYLNTQRIINYSYSRFCMEIHMDCPIKWQSTKIQNYKTTKVQKYKTEKYKNSKKTQFFF